MLEIDNAWFEEFTPDFAERISDGSYAQIGAQLCTRDGRKFGNAVVDKVENINTREGDTIISYKLLTIVTDAGNVLKLTETEVEKWFYPPQWVMDIDKARKEFFRGEYNEIT